MSSEYSLIGGAGFIGSHITEALLLEKKSVTVIDNFCSGTIGHLKNYLSNSSLRIMELNVENTNKLCDAVKGSRVIIHLASNPDIAKAINEPRIDFTQGTILTESVAEAARISNVQKILYASGSGVYGDAGQTLLNENSPLNPISTYGASKLASEALLSSYSYMFGIETVAFRFANVVGPKQTHGVAYDFIKRLLHDQTRLTVMGDGFQEKAYIHVSDIVSAVLSFSDQQLAYYDVYNVSNRDYLSVNSIAEIVFSVLGLKKHLVDIQYTGGAKGWKADVPVVRLDPTKIEQTGWVAKLTSAEAMLSAVRAMYEEFK
jgi:UDP-glucose 4-epimerase